MWSPTHIQVTGNWFDSIDWRDKYETKQNEKQKRKKKCRNNLIMWILCMEIFCDSSISSKCLLFWYWQKQNKTEQKCKFFFFFFSFAHFTVFILQNNNSNVHSFYSGFFLYCADIFGMWKCVAWILNNNNHVQLNECNYGKNVSFVWLTNDR